MTVQIGFRKSNGCLVHRLICLFQGCDEPHCEIVIDGRGVTPKHHHDGLHIRNHSYYDDDWTFIDVDWDYDKAVEFVRAHRHTPYDFLSLLAYILPQFFREDPAKNNCVKMVVRCGAYCGDPLFIGLNAALMTVCKVKALLLQKEGSVDY